MSLSIIYFIFVYSRHLIGMVTLSITQRCSPIFSVVVCLMESSMYQSAATVPRLLAVDSDVNLREKRQEWSLELESTIYEF